MFQYQDGLTTKFNTGRNKQIYTKFSQGKYEAKKVQIRRTAGAKIANATFPLDLQRHVSTCKLEGKCGRANPMLIYYFFFQ